MMTIRKFTKSKNIWKRRDTMHLNLFPTVIYYGMDPG